MNDAYTAWQWFGIALLDALILAAFAYALYERKVRRGLHHEDAPPRPDEPRPVRTAELETTQPMPMVDPERQAVRGVHRPATARVCAQLERLYPGWRVEYDLLADEYRAQADTGERSPATARAHDPWDLDREIASYIRLKDRLRALAACRTRTEVPF
ncbi:hypothetical protein CDO52_00935 [Nocardiopsis gilva YIM 90087]|uniref:Uncharacterized protein n=1 Tax=Nocardiopsis gilva YIM 90087 TaxID=1235441 RepID=A0A223S0A9_9ACTN|nr:hypothetical protein [Nocardiopsis gilva]ASU81544.1 hypothetical protein CDO52_00935 [Nocardiopsis gilva YIM 90087]